MNIYNLKQALESEKVTILNVKVLRRMSPNMFIIGDDSAIAILSDPKKAKLGLDEGAFVKIIKPTIKGDQVICNDKFGFARGTNFEYRFDEVAIDELSPTVIGEQIIQQLSDFDHIPSNQTIPNITLKVCSISRPYTGKYSEFKNIIAKDISGNKVTVTLYKKLKDFCEQGGVYTFQKL